MKRRGIVKNKVKVDGCSSCCPILQLRQFRMLIFQLWNCRHQTGEFACKSLGTLNLAQSNLQEQRLLEEKQHQVLLCQQFCWQRVACR